MRMMYGTVFVVGLLALWDRLAGWSGPHWPDLEAALRKALARWRAARDEEEQAEALLDAEEALERWAPQALKWLDRLEAAWEQGADRRSEELAALLGDLVGGDSRAVAPGPGAAAAGERGVAVCRDVGSSVIITGDANRVVVPTRVVRYPDVACPERVALATKRFQVVVRLGLAPAALSVAESPPLDLESGRTVHLHLEAPGFTPLGPLDQETQVLPNAPGPPVVFDLQPRSPGVHPLTLTFSQATVPLGSVSWSVEVVEASVAEQVRSIATPPLVADPTDPPDRLLQIALVRLPTPRLRFQLVEGATWHPAWELPLAGEPTALAERLYRDLDLLRAGTDPATHYRELNPEGVLRRLKALGQYLWTHLTPPELREHYAAHRGAWRGESLLLYTAEPHIPWELIWPYGGGWEDEGPWAMTLQVARWLLPPPGNGYTPEPPSRLPLTAFGCLAPEEEDLPAARREADHLRRLVTAHGVADRSPSDAGWKTVVDWLEAGHYDWVHVAAHGRFYPTAPDEQAALHLEGRQALTPAHLVGPRLEEHFRQARPVFIVNACSAGRLGWAWTGMGGWAQRLVAGGAGAFLAPMWTVGDKAAFTFAARFYDALLAGEPIGRAVLLARQATREAHPEDPAWLAYSLYARPSARIVLTA